VGDQLLHKTKFVNRTARNMQLLKNYKFQWSSFFWDSWPLKIWSVVCPKISIRNYNYSLRNNPGERRYSHNLRAVFEKHKFPPIPPPNLTEFSKWMKVASPVVPVIYPKWRQEKKTDSWARLCPKFRSNWPLFCVAASMIFFRKRTRHEYCFEAKCEQRVVRRNLVDKILSFCVTSCVQFVDKNIYNPPQTDSIQCHRC
jgi:hypothetical protein